MRAGYRMRSVGPYANLSSEAGRFLPPASAAYITSGVMLVGTMRLPICLRLTERGRHQSYRASGARGRAGAAPETGPPKHILIFACRPNCGPASTDRTQG